MNKNVKQSIITFVFVSLFIWIGHAVIQTLFLPETRFQDSLILSIPMADLVFRLFVILVVGIIFLMNFREEKPLDIIDINVPDEAFDQDTTGGKAFKKFIHTLRTHLNSIVGFTQLLHERGLEEKTTKTYISYLQVSKNALNTAIDDLIGSYRKVSVKSSGKQWEYIRNYDWKGMEILIAEDNEMNFTLLKNILDKTGITIHWARNGQEAVELVRNNPSIRIVLMDIIMPVMDGFEAALEIRKLRPDLPVIAQTAHPVENEKETMEQYGFQGFLTKPIWHYELILKVSRYVEEKKSPAQA